MNIDISVINWVAVQSACEAHSHSQGLNYELAFMSEPD